MIATAPSVPKADPDKQKLPPLVMKHSQEHHASVPTNKVTPVCRFFMRGCCRYGESCHLQHTNLATDLDSVAEVAGAEVPVCTFFSQNRCSRGVVCPFRHISNAITTANCRPGVADFAPPCTFYARGLCKRGRECCFSHASSETVYAACAGKSAASFITSTTSVTTPMSLPLLDLSFSSSQCIAPKPSPKPKSPLKSAADVLKKYSATRQALAAGHEVTVKTHDKARARTRQLGGEHTAIARNQCAEPEPVQCYPGAAPTKKRRGGKGKATVFVSSESSDGSMENKGIEDDDDDCICVTSDPY